MTNTLANLARMTTSTTGTGTITLGSAVDGFLAFADELTSGDVITYAIEDGNNREIGQGTYSVSGATHTLTRSTVYASTQGGSRISLSGSAQVFVTAAKQDLDNVMTDAERTKLAGIEAGATADQTGAEIKAAYEAESNTNAFTDSEKSKLTKTGAFAYETRAAFVSDLVNVSALANDGDVVTADRRQYVYVTGATAISDLADWEPLGDVTPDHWGIAQQTDEETKLQAMLDYASQNDRTVVWPTGGDYYFDNTLDIAGAYTVHWRVEGGGKCKLKSIKSAPESSPDSEWAIRLRSTFVGEIALTADMESGFDDAFSVASTASLQVGDLLHLRSTRLIESDKNGSDREGQVAVVRKIVSATSVALETTAQVFLESSNNVTGTVTTVNSTTNFELSGIAREERDMRLKMTLTSGANSGVTRYISTWNDTTNIATFSQAWPAGTLAGDSYEIEWEAVAVVYRPIQIKIEPGIVLYRDEHLTATAADPGFIGLYIDSARDALIDSIEVHDFSETCIRLRSCYRPVLRNTTVSGANKAHDTSDGTGYGINVDQCFEALIDGGTAARCRRGVDVGGSQQSSWNCTIKDFTMYGHGLTYEGNQFWPNGAEFSGGFGSHGAAFGTRYINCRAVDVYNAFNLRGVREHMLNCSHIGLGGDYSILMRTGGGHLVDGYVYDDRFSEIGNDSTTRYAVQADGSKRCKHLVRFATNTSDTLRTSLPNMIVNVTASKLVDGVINLHGSGEAAPLSFGNIRVWASDEDDATAQFLFIREDSAPKTVNHLTDLGGNKVTFDGTEYTDYQRAQWSGDVVPAKGYQQVDGVTCYVVNCADDAIVKIPHDEAGIMIDIFDLNKNRIYYATNVILYFESATNQAPTDSRTNVELSTSVLAGTTGTDAKVTLAYKPSGGDEALYIENRTGSTMRALVKITGMPAI